MVVGELTEQVDLVVIGGGPGGYVAAFKAADLGIQTVVVDESPLLGGVCLREGCIPSKALLHLAHLVDEARHVRDFGLLFEPPKIEIERVRNWKNSVVDRLCGGVKTLAGKRQVSVMQGRASFEDSRTIRVDGPSSGRLRFKNAIVATGSRPRTLPESVAPRDCYMDSTQALELAEIPPTLLVVGGGYIGLELGQVYAALGSKVTVIEALDRIVPAADEDLARPLVARLKKQFEEILTSAKLESARRVDGGVEVRWSTSAGQQTRKFGAVLVSIGRRANSDGIGLENVKVVVNDRGFIQVDEQMRTSDKRIFAIGDVIGDPMLAHKASHEGIVAAEVIAGKPSRFDARAIPAVVYTSPELAWAGLTEADVRERKIDAVIGKFPWGASGRAIAMGRPEGLTKIIADKQTQRVLGVGIVGEGAGDLIAEAVLAIEMGAEADDLAMTIHPHPNTSETIMEAAESVFGAAIHVAR